MHLYSCPKMLPEFKQCVLSGWWIRRIEVELLSSTKRPKSVSWKRQKTFRNSNAHPTPPVFIFNPWSHMKCCCNFSFVATFFELGIMLLNKAIILLSSFYFCFYNLKIEKHSGVFVFHFLSNLILSYIFKCIYKM